MNHLTDQQLLADYARHQTETAFAELVRRHVDFVYSAAVRMVRDAHLAEDVTQAVFVALAKSAAQLTARPALSGWLHRTAQNLAANAVRTDVRRRAREQEAATMNELLSAPSDASWEHIAPHLDAALGELPEADRDALLLRYFEKKSAPEMAGLLGISEEAAQKRVTRAVDRLRELFSQRKLTIGAGGLVVLISANAVQAVPAAFATTIATTALAGTAASTATIIAATKTIAMTTLQKTLVTASLAIVAGAGIYQARQAGTLRHQIQNLQQEQSPLTAQIRQLQSERDAATNQLADLQVELARATRNDAELLKLRGQAAQLQTLREQQQAQPKNPAMDQTDPTMQRFLAARAVAGQITKAMDQMPEKNIPELKLLTDVDWLSATKEAKFDTDADVRKTLSKLRSLAKNRLPIGRSLNAFIRDNNGQLPTDLSQLKPYFQSALGSAPSLTSLDDATVDAILARYTLLHTGNVSDYQPETWFIAEKTPVDKDYDSRAKFGNGRSTIFSTGLGESGDPDDKSY